jgi:hypothetical protein
MTDHEERVGGLNELLELVFAHLGGRRWIQEILSEDLKVNAEYKGQYHVESVIIRW